MAIQLQPEERDIFRIVQAIIQLVLGRGDFNGQFTLTPGATTTAVSFVNCSKGCMVDWTPRTAAAASVQASMWVSSLNQGGFVLTHAAAPSGAIFDFSCLGG